MSVIFAFEPGKPFLRGIEHYWSEIRRLDQAGPWTVHDVVLASCIRHRGNVDDYVRRLVAAGIVEKTGEMRRLVASGKPAPTYRLKDTAPVRTPRVRRDGSIGIQGRIQQQMWNVMRGPLARDGFTFNDLALWGSTDEVLVPAHTAKRYLQRIGKAGYLLQVKAARGNTPAVWRLAPKMNTGPRPPMILNATIVFDQNRMKAMSLAETIEVQP